MTIYLSDKDAARAGLTAPRQKRGRNTRPDIPSAGRSAPTGLTPLLVAGWSIEYRVGAGYRLHRGGVDTGWCESEKAACDAAKALTK